MFRVPPSSYAGPDTSWRRDAYRVALIGPECTPHHELVERSGYQVLTAADGDAATDLFGQGEAVDALVLDFDSDGRPPEAVLLFARRTSAGAPVIAIVPANKNEAYRRAFLAGARDVLPAPARGEDLLAAIDLVLEPRGLADIVEELRAQGFEDPEGTVPLMASAGADVAQRIAVLEQELRQKEEQIDEILRRKRTGTATFRQQALDAITARDRALESRERVKQKLASARRDLKERDAQLRLIERACEELNSKLKESLEHRRVVERQLVDALERLTALEGAVGEVTVPTPASPADAEAPPPGHAATPPAEEMSEPMLDPELALEVRDVDARRLDEMEELWVAYQEGLRRIRELEAALDGRTDPGRRSVDALDPDDALALREEDEGRLEDLERAHEDRTRMLDRIAELESQLLQRRAEDRVSSAGISGERAITLEVALAELDSERGAHAETLDAIRLDRDALLRRVDDAERDAADAETRLEELSPLSEQVERLRRELHAEQASHQSTRERLTRLQEQVGTDAGDPATSSPSTPLSSPAEVWERADQLQFELDRARAELDVGEKLRLDLETRLKQQDAELHSLRVRNAALLGDRTEWQRDKRSSIEAPSRGGTSGAPLDDAADFDIDL